MSDEPSKKPGLITSLLRRDLSAPRAKPPSPTLMVLGAAAGGGAGALLGHSSVMLLSSAVPGAGLWLKGPHGPPFFDLALYTAVGYGLLGAGLCQEDRRVKGAAAGFLLPLSAILLPMAAATRLFHWGEDPFAEPTLAWFYLTSAVYLVAAAGALLTLGRLEGRRWKAGGGALLGALGGYLMGLGVMRLFPSLQSSAPAGLLPPGGLFLDGLLSGGSVGLGVALTRRKPSA